MSALFSKWFGKKSKYSSAACTTRRKVRRTRLTLEQLEAREVPVVGALGIPAALSPDPTLNFGNFDMTGVVGLDFDGDSTNTVMNSECTGTLLTTGRHILTAAHCLTDLAGNIDVANMGVVFELPGGNLIMNVPSANYRFVTDASGNMLFDGTISNGEDIAILQLPALAPRAAARHSIYRGTDEVGRWFYVVGYGNTGSAQDPDGDGDCDDMGSNVKRMGTNFFDSFSSASSRLIMDFDSNTANWAGAADATRPTYNGNEVDIAPGDSGGPSFLWGPDGTLQIAAVTSGESDRNSCFGTTGASTRSSTYQGFVDSATAGPYELVIDLNSQVEGGDGSMDTLSIYAGGTILNIQLNGRFLTSPAVSDLTGIRIIGSGDADRLELFLRNLPLTITVDGRGGSDQVLLMDRNAIVTADTVTVNGTSAVMNGTTVNLTDIQSLTADLYSGSDSVTINSTSSATPVTVLGGDGADFITVGNHLSNIQSDVTVTGGNGTDRLIVNDSLFGGGDIYTIRVGDIILSGLPSLNINYTVENLVLITGNGRDSVTLQSTLSTVTTTVLTNGGNDSVTGDSRNNIFVGGAGDDSLIGNGGRDILIGGSGADTLNGGAGEDLLIGGTTLFDADLASLSAVMAEWGRTNANSAYAQRIANLRVGGGSALGRRLQLGFTVSPDTSRDTMTGGTERDWFWAQEGPLPPTNPFVEDNLTDRVLNPLASRETVN